MDLADTPSRSSSSSPAPIDTEIWIQQPGELPGLPGGPFVTADECAAGIVDAVETDGFEFFVPADLKAHVDFKNSDLPRLDRPDGGHRPREKSA